VSAGQTLTNPIIGGGTADLFSDAVVSGIITFAAGTSGTLLDADQAAMPDTAVGFAEGLDHLSFSGQTLATEAAADRSCLYPANRQRMRCSGGKPGRPP
jgi:hypothetical protein